MREMVCGLFGAALLGACSLTAVSAAAAVLPGDVNGSGTVDICDAVLLMRLINENADTELTADGEAAANLDGDSIVGLTDLSVLLRRLAVPVSGWFSEGGETYYYADGVPLTGRQKIGTDTYYFDAAGVMQTGVVTDDSGVLYLFGTDGRLQHGFVETEEHLYFADSDGALRPGWLTLGNTRYYVQENGALAREWLVFWTDPETGEEYPGIGECSDIPFDYWFFPATLYYCDEKGRIVTGAHRVGDYYYMFGDDGICQNAGDPMDAGVMELIENAPRSTAPLREIKIWDNGTDYCLTRTSFPTSLYSPYPSFKISDADIKIIEEFAAEHFTPGMTLTEKLLVTHQWIHKNVTYSYDSKAEFWSRSYPYAVFKLQMGQCAQYNGAMAAMLAYFGFDVYMVKGCVNGTSQHFWTEVLINGQRYYIETGNEGKNGHWQYFFEPVAG